MNRAEILKIAKPILFNTEMVQAILDGRKTVTRRVIKCLDYKVYDAACAHGKWFETYNPEDMPQHLVDWYAKEVAKPPYKKGDILYVRETWTKLYYVDPDGYTHYDQPMYFYAADGTPDITLCDADGFEDDDQRIRWKPSIHMSKEAARIFLRVTDVRVERLQDMDWQDALAEGSNTPYTRGTTGEFFFDYNPLYDFQDIWDSTIKKSDLDRYGWDANPWVWVIEFERVEEKR